MKHVLSGLLLLLTVTSYAQKGFAVIERAEKKIEQGHYDKALKLLSKADSMNYGFCGNAWMEAREAITLNRIKIHELTGGDPLKAANELNSAHLFYGPNLDSLKMAYFIKAIDKEKIKREVDSCINLITSVDGIDFWMELELDVDFSDEPFYLSVLTMEQLRRETFMTTDFNTGVSHIERFRLAIRRQPFYRLLD